MRAGPVPPCTYDVERVEGVATAVRLRPGTRTSPRQRRAGDLAGAARPEDKARGALTRKHTELDPQLSGRPDVGLVSRFRVEHGRIVELWIEPAESRAG